MSPTQRWILLAAALGAVCLATGMTPPGPTRVQQQGSAAVWLLPSPGPDGRLTVRLSAIVTVKITVEGKAPLEVEPIRRITDSAGWKVVHVTPSTNTFVAMDRMGWEQTFQLMPQDKGDHPLPLAAIKYRTGMGSWQTATWKSIPVTIATTIRRVDVTEARDITEIEHLPSFPSWWEGAIWPVLGLLIVSLTVAGWFLLRRRRRSASPLAADQAALRELEHLEALKLPQAGRGGRFYSLVSNILRRYFEKRFQLPVRRQTTAEFLAAMDLATHLAAPQQALLRDFLERCDLAKFAGIAPTPDDCEGIATKARMLLQETAAKPTAAEKAAGTKSG